MNHREAHPERSPGGRTYSLDWLPRSRSPRIAYGFAVGASLVAAAASAAFREASGETTLLPLIAAVVLAGVYGGPGAGLTATMITAACAALFVLAPFERLDNDAAGLPYLGIYAAVALAVTMLFAIVDASRQSALREGERAQAALAREHGVRTEAEKARERLRLAQQSGRLGAWEWDLRTNALVWDGVESVHGLTEGAFGGSFEAYLADILPDDREQVMQAITEALEHGTELDNEYRIVWPDGSLHWVAGKGRAFYEDGKPVRMSGICMDITDRKVAELEALEGSGRYRSLAEALPAIVCTATPDGQFDYLNDGFFEYTGLDREHLPAPLWKAVMHPDDYARFVAEWESARREVRRSESEFRLLGRDGIYRWHFGLAVPVRDAAGAHASWVLTCIDIDVRKHTEEAQRFLGEATGVLASSLDYETTLRNIGRLAVPTIADWFAIDLAEGADVRRVCVDHVDPAKVQWAYELQDRYPPDPDAERGVYHVIRTGESELYEDITDEMLIESARDEEALQIARRIGMRSAMVVPIRARGRMLGAVTFVSAESRRRYGPLDLQLAEALGYRAGMAIDNAELYRQAQDVADDLRRANAVKDEFLGLVSHELRTPITTIYGNTRVLRLRGATIDEESRTQALADMEHETERLQRLIENMLVLARAESGGHAATQLEPVLLQHEIQRVIDAHLRQHVRRAINFQAPALPPALAEPTYLEQVLRNLIGNAEKYSPDDAPIDIYAEAQDGELRITVADRGAGVPEEETELIFESFYRSKRTAAGAPGAGIGLTVSKRLMEAQGGRIWAAPRDGGGLCISLALPAHPEGASPASSAPAPASQPA